MHKKILIACTLFAVLTSTHAVVAETFSTTGSHLYAIFPSNNLLNLLNLNLSPTITNTSSINNLQADIFNATFSSISDHNITFVFKKDVAIDGMLLPVDFTFDALMTTVFDRLNLQHNEVIYLGGESFKLLDDTTGRFDIFHHADNNFAVKVEVKVVPKPEIHAILLIGLGLLSFTARRRKHIP
ncbi:hypothetical protein [Nitrosomonas supralitoralis]|uniref:hypothetical protein n=1 Tax=Nitrosomonas supralitoralis TaxID=2116706 RepID=UPI0011C42768|nr:hypothetical protein [Nitrosomonas supralitoralis]